MRVGMSTALSVGMLASVFSACAAVPGDAESTAAEDLRSRPFCTTNCITEVPLRANSDGAFGVTTGPLHSIWYGHGDNIGRYDPLTRREVEYPVPSTDPDVGWVTADDDVVWFAERNTGKIGRIDIFGRVTEFTPPTANAGPQGIVVIHGQVWFTEQDGNNIGHLDPRTGHIQEFAIPTADSGPLGLVEGPDGALWFTERGADKVGRMTLSGHFTEYALAAGAGVQRIVVGTDHAIWFTELGANSLGRITCSGQLTQYPLASDGGPVGITVGNDGAFYVVLFLTNAIARFDIHGHLTNTWTLPHDDGFPLQITQGFGNDFWVGDNDRNALEHLETYAR